MWCTTINALTGGRMLGNKRYPEDRYLPNQSDREWDVHRYPANQNDQSRWENGRYRPNQSDSNYPSGSAIIGYRSVSDTNHFSHYHCPRCPDGNCDRKIQSCCAFL